MNSSDKKQIYKIILYFLILSFSSLHINSSLSAQEETDEAIVPAANWFHEFDRKIAVGSARNQIMINIQLDRTISEHNVETAMREEFEILRVESIPQFGKPASSIYIYVYENIDDSKVQWLGLLTWDDRHIETPRPNPDSISPSITINHDKINIIEKRTGTRFGLSEEERVIVFRSQAYIIIKNKIYADSNRPKTDDSTVLALHHKAMEKALKQLTRSLANQHKITIEIVAQIYNEGLKKDWPFPKDIDRSLLKPLKNK